ncbi:hypothetical protein EW145_g1364 [Phellinidium pouzarii]|uniref:Uncharacterized protein n=1 Tax=Phellinidium pouzarii TaxID=167371 RepID=A0A4S4LGL7_9AGAM|nr:hypothetical protein EW145_g1364 [Phellinidium pouzarii]
MRPLSSCVTKTKAKNTDTPWRTDKLTNARGIAGASVRSVERRHVPLMSRVLFHKNVHALGGMRSFASVASSVTDIGRKPLFDKILIANRGEIACRVIRTAKRLGIRTVAVYSEVDSESLHVRLADEAYCIGPAPSSESYLRMDEIIFVARRSGAQAIHPGYGFLSENANFARRLADEGIVFIGPSPSSIESMGSKSESKDIMTAAGVPCVPGYHGTEQSPERLQHEAAQIGFPVLIKAVMGGGGKGMRIVHAPEDFPDALESARREARKSFGDERVLVEKYIVRPRHIEVQVFGDAFGNCVSLWERDCSVQRRHQKIIEEAPAPGLSEELRADLCQKAVAAAKAVNYHGAGTVEFILDNDTERFFLHGDEHEIASRTGNPLPLSQADIPRIGHAFEARIYAENPRNDFLPDVGPLLFLSTPTASSTIRLEEGFLQGSNIEVFYDPLISKLIAHGRDRTDALRILRKALEEYQVVGVSTNIEFLTILAGNTDFINGNVETGFIQKHHDKLFPPINLPEPEALAQAALFTVLRDMPSVLTSSKASPWLSLGPRRFGGDIYERTITLQHDESPEGDPPVTVCIKFLGQGLYDVTVSTYFSMSRFRSVSAQLSSPTSVLSTLKDKQLHTTVVAQPPARAAAHAGERLHVFHDARRSTLRIVPPRWLETLKEGVLAAQSGGGSVRAPMPSLVVDVRVSAGDAVTPGQVLVVLESMKTETALRASAAGIVRGVACAKGEMVEEGRVLVEVEPEAEVPSLE